MKVATLSNPVTSGWFQEQGLRLDASPYVSGALKVRKLLERLPETVKLASLTTGYNGGIFNGPMFRRVYLTDPEHSVPLLGTKDMMAADLTGLPRLRKADAHSAALSYLELKPGMTLISCSGYNAGRRAYVRPDMGGIWSSQDTLKVQPAPEKIKPDTSTPSCSAGSGRRSCAGRCTVRPSSTSSRTTSWGFRYRAWANGSSPRSMSWSSRARGCALVTRPNSSPRRRTSLTATGCPS